MNIGRPPTVAERASLGIDGDFRITDDGTPAGTIAKGYNCFCFCFGFEDWLSPYDGPDGGARLLHEMGYMSKQEPPASGSVLALFYNAQEAQPWHVAKRLGGDCYESKCGDGPRVVHRLGAITRRYGQVISYWVPGPSAERIKGDFLVDHDPIEDSALLLAKEGLIAGSTTPEV